MILFHFVAGVIGVLIGIQFFRELTEDRPYIWTILKTKKAGSSPKNISRTYTAIIFVMLLMFVLGILMFVTSPLPA